MTFAYYATKLTARYLSRPSREQTSDKARPRSTWTATNSNTPYEYPWGVKQRNPFFIGPFPQDEHAAKEPT